MASSRIKPVLLIDEAQEMTPEVLSELRILSSADFDATSLLTVVLSGDGRLLELLRHQDLVPLGTRIRTRLNTEPASREELFELLSHALAKAGNATLMTAELMDTLVDHCRRQLPPADDHGRRTAGLRHGPRSRDSSTRNVTWRFFSPTRPPPGSEEESEGLKMIAKSDSAASRRADRGDLPRRTTPDAGWSSSCGAPRRSA